MQRPCDEGHHGATMVHRAMALRRGPQQREDPGTLAPTMRTRIYQVRIPSTSMRAAAACSRTATEPARTCTMGEGEHEGGQHTMMVGTGRHHWERDTAQSSEK